MTASVLLVNYDNNSVTPQFPSGLAYLAGALRAAGHQVSVFDMATEHYTPEELTAHLDANAYDVVGVGSCGGYWQFWQLLAISAAVNASKRRDAFKFIAGGHMVSPDPAYFMTRLRTDAVFVGESEDSLVDYLSNGCKRVAGMHDWSGLYQARPLREDVDGFALPAWDLFNMSVYRLCSYPRKDPTAFAAPVLSGRGCSGSCTFCYRMDPGWRKRDPKAIVDEVARLRRDYRVSYINFSDELLAGSRARITQVCEEFLRAPFQFSWMCNMRVQFAKPDMLALMKRAGCVLANFGIESLSDDVLRDIGKNQTVEQIHKGVRATLDSGIGPGLNVIWPTSIHDSQATLDAIVDFLLAHDDGSQCRTIRPCTAYPGTAMFEQAVAAGQVASVQDFYERAHTNSDLISTNLTSIPTPDAHRMLLDANLRLMANYRDRWARSHEEQLRRLYLDNDTSFRGFRHT